MAGIPESELLPTERPSTNVPDPALHLQVSPEAFGGYKARIAKGVEQLGQGALIGAEHWGQIQADDVSNQFEDAARKIVYGDPNKTNPDGTPDLGFHGLKGADALQQRGAYEKLLQDARNQARGKLLSADAQLYFDRNSKRYYNILTGDMGRHGVQQAYAYSMEVNRSTIKLRNEEIASDPDNEEKFLHNTADIVHAAVKAAQLQYGANVSPEIINERINTAKAVAAETRINAVGATDPIRAQQMIDHYKEVLGPHYHTLTDHYRGRVLRQQGINIGDQVAGGEGGAANELNIGNVRPRSGMGFAQVHSFDEGVALTVRNARAYPDAFNDGKLMSLLQIGQHWVGPKSESRLNDPVQWAKNVASTSGLPVDQPINLSDPEVAAKFARGVHAAEWGPAKIKPLADYSAGARGIYAAPPETSPPTQLEMMQKIHDMHLDPIAESAAIGRINRIATLRQDTIVHQRMAFDAKVKDSTAEAMNTGTTRNPIVRSDFVRNYGEAEGETKYQAYADDIKFGADWKSLHDMPNDAQQVLVNSREPEAGQPDYSRRLQNQQRLQKAVDLIQKHRSEDPAGSVARDPLVMGALAQYKPNQPDSFRPVVEARLAAQTKVGIPDAVQSAISENEAKQYAAALKPVAKDEADPAQQDQVINGIVQNIGAKYGDHAKEALTRVLYHVTLKHDAAGVLADAITKLARGHEPQIGPEESKRLQIERDAERAAQLAGQLRERSELAGPSAAEAAAGMPNVAQIGRMVHQTEQKVQKPFSEAIDVLRSDPTKYMPFFVQKFGVSKVPADLMQYVPKPKSTAGE